MILCYLALSTLSVLKLYFCINNNNSWYFYRFYFVPATATTDSNVLTHYFSQRPCVILQIINCIERPYYWLRQVVTDGVWIWKLISEFRLLTIIFTLVIIFMNARWEFPSRMIICLWIFYLFTFYLLGFYPSRLIWSRFTWSLHFTLPANSSNTVLTWSPV